VRADGPCPGPDPGCADFTVPPWSDGARWTDPNHFTTILTADLDGDGRVELIGRSSEGLEIWEMPAEGACEGPGTGCGRWEFASINEDFSDDNGFDDALLASTIHAARLYGTPAAQIYVWDSTGVLVYSYDKSTKQLSQTDRVSQFESTYGDDPSQARYLETLQAAAWLPEDGATVKGSLNLAMRDINNDG
jgi:hypothetical protein